MTLETLQKQLIDEKKRKQELLNICDNQINGIEELLATFEVRQRLCVPIEKAVLIRHEEYFLVVVNHLLHSKQDHVGFKLIEANGDTRFSVRLNLIEQIIVEHYGEYECVDFKVRMLSLLQSWRKSKMPIRYRRTTSVDLANPKSECYPQTYAVEMAVSTFETMFNTYLETNGEEVWGWNERHKSQ